jgi:hypothetical protein
MQPSRVTTGFALGVLAPVVRSQDLVQLLAARERDVQLEEEAVELRFGQRVRALALERVLRREHEERLVELVGLRRRSRGAPASPRAARSASSGSRG